MPKHCRQSAYNKKVKRKVILIAIPTLLVIIIFTVAIYEKWCEVETKPLLNRLEQIANHEIEVDQSAGKECRFSLNLTANADEVFQKATLRFVIFS